MTTPWWRPDHFARKWPRLEKRAAIVRALRRLFEEAGFLEVETPALQVSPGLEPHLHAFETELVDATGGRHRRLLHTSPEFAMKKLLVAGVPRLFQLARVFRNAEGGRLHHPEFTMLEWYRAEPSLEALIADCELVLRRAADAAGVTQAGWQGRIADPRLPAERLSVAAAFERHCGIDILATAPDPARPDAALLAREARRIGIEPHPGDAWDDLFFRIFLERIEPHLGIGAPTVLTDYPVSMAALARPSAADPRVAERFELYVAGVELANAFGELTDAGEQRRRFQHDVARKEALYGRAYPIDEDFLAALEHGMPASAGIALGVDRLVMLLTGAAAIEDVLWAPVAGAQDGF
jgi:lysyl-tRNA synthetase class 2